MKGSKIEAVEEVKAPKKREQRTSLFVLFEDDDGHKALISFNDKASFDEWLEKTSCRVLNVIRGNEKKMKQRVVFV